MAGNSEVTVKFLAPYYLHGEQYYPGALVNFPLAVAEKLFRKRVVLLLWCNDEDPNSAPEPANHRA